MIRAAAALVAIAAVAAGCSGSGARVAVPRTEFMSLPAALATLHHAGLGAAVPYFPPLPRSAGGPNGNDLSTYRVVWQAPAHGASVRPGSPVSLALGVEGPMALASIVEPNSHPGSVAAPNLVGRTYEQAMNQGEDWPGYWVEVGKVAPVTAADGIGSLRVVAQSPAPGTRMPFGGIRPHVSGVAPAVSTVTVTLGSKGQAAKDAVLASNRATAHAASLLRIGTEFEVGRLGSLFPRTAGSRGCLIQRGTSVTRTVPGTCWTTVEPGLAGGAVVYRELWDGRDFRAGGAPAKPDLEHSWRIAVDGTGAVRRIFESGAVPPQKAPGITPEPGRMEAIWLKLLGEPATERAARGHAARQLEARLRAAVVSSGADALKVRAVALQGMEPGVALAMRAEHPAIFLRDRLRPIIRGASLGDRPAYVLVLDKTGERVFEWYQSEFGSAVYVPQRLEDCSPVEAVGWTDIPGCPA